MRTAKPGLLLAAGLSLSLSGVGVTSPDFEAFARDLADLVSDGQRTTLAEATAVDGSDDQYHPSGEEPGIAPPETDIALAASFAAETGGSLDCQRGGTLCSPARAGQAAGTSFHAYAGKMHEPLLPQAGRRLEFGVVAFDESPRDGRPAEAWEAIPEFPGDFFQGSNVAWTLVSENGEPFRLFRLEYGPGDAGFLAAPTDAIAILRGSAWAILVPASEWEGTVNSRLFVFRADGGDLSPETSVVDTYPDISAPARPSAGSPTITVDWRPSGDSTVWFAAGAAAGLGMALIVGALLIARRRRAR